MRGAHNLSGLIIQGEHSLRKMRKTNENGLTLAEAAEGAPTFPSLLAVFHSAEIVSVACSRSPSTKLSIFLSTLARVASVESVTQAWASCSTYRFLISAYLHPLVNKQSALAMCFAYRDVNLLNDSSTMSHLLSSLRMRFNARVFNVGTSYCDEVLSDARYTELSIEKTRHKLYPQVGRSTSETVEGPCCQKGPRFLHFVICDSPRTQTVRTRLRPYRDTTEKPGIYSTINENLKRSQTSTHVTKAISGILTTFPFPTCSSFFS